MEPILITGCGLGATHYTARVLQNCGIDVRHESDGKEGAVSWKAVRKADEYDKVICQVRNPRKVATSMGETANRSSWRLAAAALEDRYDLDLDWPPQQSEPDQVRSAGVAYTVFWYSLCMERADWTFRVEDMKTVLPQLLRAVGADVPEADWQSALEVSTRAASRKKKRGYEYLSWGEIENTRYGRDLKILSRAWGYL